jgi:CheY-like chemotaxis protein
MLTYLIDDDQISLFVTEQVLRTEGLVPHVHSFTAAEEALAHLLPRLSTAPPQLILLDLNMAVMDGWEFLAALEPHQDALQGCFIYLLTSSLAPADAVKAKEYAYLVDIIHKPMNEYDVKVIQAAMLASADGKTV